jgi:hypothetical protein
MNHWQENLNLPRSGSNLNAATARSNDDASVRLVVAAHNPGVTNWNDTAGHAHGVMLFRWFGTEVDRALPATRVVKLEEVEPDGTRAGDRRHRQVAPGYLAPRIG